MVDGIHFTCDLCRGELDAPASAVGERMVCPRCDGLIVVPRQAETPPPAPAGPPPLPEQPTEERDEPEAAVRPMVYPERQHTAMTAVAWAISLVFHAL